jgi:hypothetical protein
MGTDPDATELLRVWIVNQELECSLFPGVFDDPTIWGVVLADLARNVAKGLHDTEGKDLEATLKQIVDSFNQEIANPPES